MTHRLLCIVGVSASGKSTLARNLAREGVREVVSHTTRTRRVGEVPDQSYHFVSAETFEDLVYCGSMLEHVRYGNHSYGVSKIAVANALLESPACVVVEAHGAEQIKAALGRKASVLFLSAPPTDELRRRMLARGDPPVAIDDRLATVEAETSAGLRVAEYVLFPAGPQETLRQALRIVDAG